MRHLLPVVLLVLSSVSAFAQISPTVRVVTLGQLDGPRLRQMPQGYCGPHFTFAPTDSRGGGIVFFGVRPEEAEKKEKYKDDTQVVSFIAGSIRLRRCETCDAPKAEREVQGSSEWINLSISDMHLELSTCLRALKVSKK